MNKQELIGRMKGFKKIFGNKVEYIELDLAIELASRLDEPQKVTVPQFVADYIEFKKENDFHIYGAMRVIEDHYDKRVPEWFYKKNIETFARAWLDGYTVEKEKRYIVKLKGVEEGYDYLNYRTSADKWFFSGETEPLDYRTKHTRKELEDAGFGWVFDCPGMEVEEVE